MNRRIIATLTAIALLALSACDKQTETGLYSETEIGLRAMSTATKSAIYGTAFPEGYDMLVSAYFNTGAYKGGDTPKNYFKGIRFTKTGTAWKSTTEPKYYPIDGTLDFLAIASAGLKDDSKGIVPMAVWGDSEVPSNYAKQVVVTVPDNSTKFDDLLYGAANAQGTSTTGTGIAFQHAMTSVVFVARCNVPYVFNETTNKGITLTGITIDDAYYSGTLTVSNPAAAGGEGELTAEWSGLGSQVGHLPARVWDSNNTGVKTDEGAFSELHLSNTATAIDASHPFGNAYVLLPAQPAARFTIHYTQHNGFEANGVTPLDVDHQYQVTPTGTWAMGKKNIYSLNFTLTEIQVTPEVTNWDDKPIDQPLPDPANGHAYVDLGLRQGGNKVLFATVNLGANSETEYGDYYQWGDIVKRYDSITGTTINSTSGFSFDYNHYLWCNGDYSSMTKYYSGDSKTTLDEADDAAHVLWGGGWRIPTETEINALLGLESFEFVENYNGSGVNGWVVGGTGAAYQEASIFLPEAGEAWMQSVDSNQTRYWTKTRDSLPYRASVLYSSTSHGNLTTSPMMRSSGAPIRPVLVIPE